ncbi:hypothetical protein [Streptomyces anulatus]|uniref:hypothetical protein n=1 Tax=Streptomyces anulatus TaxID=1892 RepID=UPI0038695B96|nr:hypothetical protein OG865_03910 [Streptomyces anulatus]
MTCRNGQSSLPAVPTLPAGLTDAVKTGGYWFSKYNTTVALKDHTLSFTVGG